MTRCQPSPPQHMLGHWEATYTDKLQLETKMALGNEAGSAGEADSEEHNTGSAAPAERLRPTSCSYSRPDGRAEPLQSPWRV